MRKQLGNRSFIGYSLFFKLVVCVSSIFFTGCAGLSGNSLPKRDVVKIQSSVYQDEKLEIRAYIYRPTELGPSPYPAVILLHSSLGITSRQVNFAKKLINNGYAVMIVDYFSGRNKIKSNIGTFTDHVNDAYYFLRSLPDIDPNRIGVAGWSLGAKCGQYFVGYLPEAEKTKALVEFYSASGRIPPHNCKSHSCPPMLFLSGLYDHMGIRPEHLKSFCRNQSYFNKDCEIVLYKAGHQFDDDTNRQNYNPGVTTDAYKRAVDFFDYHVKNYDPKNYKHCDLCDY